MRFFSFDTETYPIVDGMKCPKMVCLSYCDGTEEGVELREEGIARLHRELDGDAYFVGVNLPYDFAVCIAEDETLKVKVFRAYEEGRVRGVDIRQCLIDIAKGEHKYRRTAEGRIKTSYALDELVKYMFDEEVSKEGDSPEEPGYWRLRYRELDGIPVSQWPSAAYAYALGDATWGYRMWMKQFEEEAFDVPNEIEQNCAQFALHLSGIWGLRTDAKRVAKFRARVQKAYTQIYEELKEAGLVRADGTRDMEKIGDAVIAAYAAKGVPTPMTPRGRVKTSEEALLESDDKILTLLAQTSELRTTLTRYIPMLETGVRVPMNPGWVPLLETGRVACREPNVMNPPRNAVKIKHEDGTTEELGDVRSCFTPREGNAYVGADYDGAELRSWCQVCIDLLGYSSMNEAIKKGEDLHLRLAAVILGISYEEAKQRYEEGDVEVFNARQLSKILNFGLQGGMGARRLEVAFHEAGIEITLDQAKQYIAAWRATWMEGKPYLDYINSRTGYGGEFDMIQLRSGRVRGGVQYSDSANSFFQGLTADGAKAAMWQITKECYLESPNGPGSPRSPLYGARMVLFLHDEFILECAEHRVHEVAKRLREIMIEQMKRYLPDVPVDATPNAMRSWRKGSKPVYVNGSLVPGRPEKKDGKTVWVADL